MALNKTECEDDMLKDDESQVALSNSNPNWADAMANILKTNKPKRKKGIVLAKAKKAPGPFIQTSIESNSEIGSVKNEIGLDTKTDLNKKVKKKELTARCRTKPTVLGANREKTLAKVATRGIVQLFNAVRLQQKLIESELGKAGSSELKRDKILRTYNQPSIIETLMGPIKSQAVEEHVNAVDTKVEEAPMWDVLRDDFMMTSKLKNWDKEISDAC